MTIKVNGKVRRFVPVSHCLQNVCHISLKRSTSCHRVFFPPPGHLRSGAGQPENVVRPLQRTVLRATAAKDLEPSGTWPDSEVHLGKGVADYGDAP